jgi:hypothetical protein
MMVAGGAEGIVYSINGRVGIVVLSSSDVNLENCDNTSDLDKPLSTAQIAALNNKVDKVSGKELSANDFTDILKSKLDNIESEAQLNALASLPTPSALYLNKVYQFIGTTGTYVQYSFYRCILAGETYSWELCNPIPIWGNFTGDISNQTDLQAALDGKQKNLVAGANIIIEPGETEDIISAQLPDLPPGAVQSFYMDSSTTIGATKPTSDVSADISLVGTTAIQKDLTYTASLDSSFNTQTVMRYHVRLTNLNIGTRYTWRPVLHAIKDTVDTIIAEIPSGQAVIFTAESTVYKATVAVPYALYTDYDAPAGTAFNLALRLVKDGSDTQNITIETDIATGEYVYFSRSGGYISTDQVYEVDGETVKTQHTINVENANAITNNAEDLVLLNEKVDALIVSASNISISTWVANTDNTTIYDKGYIYMANVTVTGMLSTMYPTITVDLTTYISGNMWDRYQSFDGYIRIYSKTNTTITVLTAIGEVIT